MLEETIDPRLNAKLVETHTSMLNSGELLSSQRLDECYTLFRSKFGPDALQQLDGEALLNTMHSTDQDGLVYWLEFKNDEEFPSTSFGSIGGGTALKYGIYRSKKTGVWMTGSPRKITELSINDAIDIAYKHRNEISAGTEILSNLPENATDAEYAKLQGDLNQVAPTVCDTSWGHKYFSLLFPNKLDDFHAKSYRDFQLQKLLIRPPDGEGRYLSAGIFVRIAHFFEWPLNHLTAVLYRVNGPPYKRWRIGTDLGQDRANSIWPMMRESACVAIGWARLGDLSELEHDKNSKAKIEKSLKANYNLNANVASRKATEILRFATVMKEGEPVLAASGNQILGIGRIVGPYRYEPLSNEKAPHQRDVDWFSTEVFNLPHSEGLQTTVYMLERSPDNLIDIERRLLDTPSSTVQPRTRPGRAVRLDGDSGRIQSALVRKGQVIVYGPPGTGKTYWARRTGLDLASLAAFGKNFDQLEPSEQKKVEGDSNQRGLYRMCTFHPAYDYGDFIEGFRPTTGQNDALTFNLSPGIFKQICLDAEAEDQLSFYLHIDEINRGDIPRIFGELLTLMEKDKRGKFVELPVSNDKFRIPENVYVIGTMNTADRSIALLDTAMRRRFGFVELMPNPDQLGDTVVEEKIPLAGWLESLNDRIREHVGHDARNLQVGHSYLMKGDKPITSLDEFVQILAEDIIPLLEEYCYENYGTLAQILGKTLIDESKQRIRFELTDPSRRDELLAALFERSPELATSQEMVTQTEVPNEEIEGAAGDSGVT